MAAADSENHDEFYTHDGLHRLKNFDRGDLNVGKTAISGTPGVEQDYTLDQLGNWENVLTKAGGSTTLDQDRTHNAANEIQTIDALPNPTHDAAGNMTTIPRTPDSELTADEYEAGYDAWNRMVGIFSDSPNRSHYMEYDGLHRRIARHEPDSIHYFYNERWQCLEERIENSIGQMDASPVRQYVWHPYYIDALAASYDDGGNKTFYTQDANFNVTAALDDSGAVVERYQYSPYGEVTYLEADFDVAATQVSTIGNEFLYTGRRRDSETGLQYSRHRYYHPQLGRWVNRDPIGYAAGDMNLYGYVGGMPTRFEDPFGLEPWLLPWDRGASWNPVTTAKLWFSHGPRGHLRGLYTTDTDDRGATTSAALNGAGESVLENADTAQGVADTIAYVDPTPLSDSVSAGLDYAKGDDEAAKSKLKGAALGPVGDLARGMRFCKNALKKSDDVPALPPPTAKPKPTEGNPNTAPEHGTIYVDSNGNAIPTPPGGSLSSSPDGVWQQARDASGKPTGVRKDGGHPAASHPDPRAQDPHGHQPGFTNPDGTPWLPIKK